MFIKTQLMKIIQKLFKAAHYHQYEYRRLFKIFSQYYINGARNVLDVGCGYGTYMRMLKNLNYEVIGVDANPIHVKKNIEEGFISYTVEEFRNKHEGQFDIILMSHLVEHLDYQDLLEVMQFYIDHLKDGGLVIIATPLATERFWYDYTHIRPYMPQSIWHAFGSNNEEISIAKQNFFLQLTSIYFIKDSYRTRKNRSYYIRANNNILYLLTNWYNAFLAALYIISAANIGTKMSWIGVYKMAKKASL
jgi:2-polyprenyl-3-methyl-5-hydroxy-6-metoxy-1,4-benzoquinol methylase